MVEKDCLVVHEEIGKVWQRSSGKEHQDKIREGLFKSNLKRRIREYG
jgi:hypothetical protein